MLHPPPTDPLVDTARQVLVGHFRSDDWHGVGVVFSLAASSVLVQMDDGIFRLWADLGAGQWIMSLTWSGATWGTPTEPRICSLELELVSADEPVDDVDELELGPDCGCSCAELAPAIGLL